MIKRNPERKRQRKQNTLNTERLEQRAMFSVSPMNFDVELKQPIQDNSPVAHATSKYIGSVSLVVSPGGHHSVGQQFVELPSNVFHQEPPTINDVFNQSPLMDERIEQLSPSWNNFSDAIMQEDYRSQFFERGVVGITGGDMVEYWAESGTRGYYAADQGYNDALEHREEQLSQIDGMEDVDLNNDEKTGPNKENNDYDDLEEKGWLSKLVEEVKEWLSDDEDDDDDDDTSGITAESEGRYLLHESPASDADSMAERFRNVREIYDPFETIANQDNYSPNNFIRVNAYMKARSQVFAMMGR